MIGDIAKIVTAHTIEIERLKARLELCERKMRAMEYLAEVEALEVGHFWGFPVFKYQKKRRRSWLYWITPLRIRI